MGSYKYNFNHLNFPPGSGMHLNISLWSTDEEKNLFQDKDGKSELGVTPIGQHFIAGILKHADALCAMVCPSVNSYKRWVSCGVCHCVPVHRQL